MLDPDISTADALAELRRTEPATAATLDRRRFLQLVGMGVGAGLVGGGTGSLLDGLAGWHDGTAWAAGPLGAHDGVLVVIGMYGGNDGLNTVVPVDDAAYYDMHGDLAVAAGQTLPLATGSGLHPELTEVAERWDAGEVAIVEGIGYPEPDLSHFNSMAFWMAGRPHAIPTSGWLGRWLDGHLAGTKDLYAAAEVGYSVPLHLIGDAQRGTVVPPNRPGYGASTDPRYVRQYDALRAMRTGANGPWFGAVAEAFVDQLDLAATLAPVIPDELPDVDLVARLEIIARLINANLGFRVLTVGYGDFDSHAGQPTQHTARMQELNAGLRRFREVLDDGWASRVALATFSEFGRTPWGNDGAGTDHGTAAPHLVIGHNVRGGFYGQRPALAGLGRWDRMAHHVDYRAYYASLVDGWLGGGSAEVLDETYEDLGLFRAGPGEGGTGGGGGGGGGSTPPTVTTASVFTPLPPRRIADTRTGTGGTPRRRLRPGESTRIQVAGAGGIPAAGCRAVVANVVAVDATTAMYFTVHPSGSDRPGTASLNGQPGRPVPNLVVMGVGDDGCIEVFNSHGRTHCVVDVFGYFADGSGDRLVAVQPARLFDTRSGEGVRRGKLRDGGQVDVQVAGRAGVPAAGATAVVMNLAATAPESNGYLRTTPAGQRGADTANVNFFAGDTVPNLVICKLGTGGRITLHGRGTGTHAVGDVFGYFADDGERLRAMSPRRFLDTRDGVGARRGPVGPGATVDVGVAGRHGVPAEATAVVMNVAATNIAAPSYVSVWPAGEPHPGTANLNLVPGRNIANLVICRLGEDGAVRIGNRRAQCDVIADVCGYFVD